jgi:Phosphatidylglycerophosphate synthase
LGARGGHSAGRRGVFPANRLDDLPERNLTATILFILSAITDWLDGYLARKWNQTSAFGAFLDPVATS